MRIPLRQVGTERMEAELQGRDDPEVGAGPTHRPEQVRMVSLARSHVRAVSRHELDGRQVVEGQAESSLEPADAAAERQAGDAGVPDGPDGADEAMRLGRAVEFAEMRPAIRACEAAVRVDGDAAHPRQVDDDAIVAGREAGDAVASAADRDPEVRLARVPDGCDDILHALRPNDQPGPPIVEGAPDASRVVIVGLARSDDLAHEGRAEAVEDWVRERQGETSKRTSPEVTRPTTGPPPLSRLAWLRRVGHGSNVPSQRDGVIVKSSTLFHSRARTVWSPTATVDARLACAAAAI